MESSQSERKETGKKPLTAEEAAALRKKESLMLARVHVEQQMKNSQHPRHREILQKALEDLEKRLGEFGAIERAAGSA